MRKMLRCLVPFLFLALGSAGGWVYVHSDRPSGEESSKETSAREAARPGESHELHGKPAVTAEDPLLEVERGDRWLREGRFDFALGAYRQAAAAMGADFQPGLAYRQALCEEALGRWQAATKGYQTALEQDTLDGLRLAANLGMARVQIRQGKPANARPVLAAVLLRGQIAEQRMKPLLADARYLWAWSLAAELSPQPIPDPLDDLPAGARPLEWWGTGVLQLDELLRQPVVPRAPLRSAPVVVHPFAGGEPEAASVQLVQVQLPLRQFLESLAQASSLRLELSPSAQRAIEGQSISVVVANLALGDLLALVLIPRELGWRVQGDALRIVRENEMEASERLACRLAAVRRSLNGALVAQSNHVMAGVAQQSLGNYAFAQRDFAEAESWYEKQARAQLWSNEAMAANFNLGLALLKQEKRKAARAAFFRVIDQQPGHELAALASLRLGQLAVIEGEPRQAITALRRALAHASTEPLRSLAVVRLSVAQLLAGQPEAANATLFAERHAMQEESARSAAAFLDTYARFRIQGGRGAVSRHAGELLAALLALPSTATIGEGGELLMARAYLDLGADESAARICTQALSRIKGPLAEELTFALADIRYREHRQGQAAEMFTALASTAGSPWASPARFRLAEIALADDRADDCLFLCSQLLREDPGFDRVVLFPVMGRAYEKMGKHVLAAKCFAGLPPE